MIRFLAIRLSLLLALVAPPFGGQAQETPAIGTPTVTAEKPAPYDARLLRLSEILGSVHYLRTLCKDGTADSWRQSMQDLLDKEAGNEAQRRCIVDGVVEHVFRDDTARSAFAEWARDPVLKVAYAEAAEWDN